MNNYKKIILDNGIPLYLYNDKSLKQVFVNYIIKYGSDGKWFDFELDNKKYHVLPGYAHYLEHLLLEHSKYGDLISRFDEKYYHSNAETANNYTSYYFYGVEDIKNSIKQLIETIDCPVFNKKDVEHSRHAIEEEASMTVDDLYSVSINLTERNLYGGYEVFDKTLSPIGNRKTTKEINIDDLYNCYNAFYTNDKKVLVIAGNVNEEELVDYLNEIYSKIPRNNNHDLILPNYDYSAIRKAEDTIFRNVEKDIYGLGIKIKKPKLMTKEDFGICLNFIYNHLLCGSSNFMIDLFNNNLVDDLHYGWLNWNKDYVNFLHNFSSIDKNAYYDVFLEKINNLNISNEEFEYLRRNFVAEEIRNLDNKYYYPSKFGYRMNYTDNYSDAKYYKNLNYDKFNELIKQLDFNNYTKTQVKKRKR